MLALVELLRRRWWLIVTVTALCLVAAGAYAWGQRKVYESTATVYIGLSHKFVTKANQATIESQLGLLTYGSLVNTFVSIAQSRSTLADAANTLAISRNRLKLYTPVVTVRPQSFVLDMSVDGPDGTTVTALANRLSQKAATVVTTGFPIVSLSSLDPASTSSQIQPRLKRDLLYGALAGLILGLVAAGLSLYRKPPAIDLQTPYGEGTRGEGGSDTATESRAGDVEMPSARMR